MIVNYVDYGGYIHAYVDHMCNLTAPIYKYMYGLKFAVDILVCS